MKQNLSLYLLLAVLTFLAACQNPGVLQPAATSFPPAVSPTSTLIVEPPTEVIVPTTTPTQPGTVLITPDAIQVEKWQEYQTALAKNVLAHLPAEEVLCEWDILGRSGSDVYVWAVCRGEVGGGSVPAILHLGTDGDIQSVERAINWSADIPRLFPPDVRERFPLYPAGRAKELQEHIDWRRMHPDEPPLIVLSATPTP